MNATKYNKTIKLSKNEMRKGGFFVKSKINNDILFKYYNYLKDIGNSEGTINIKLDAVIRLENYLNSLNVNLCDITKNILYDYLDLYSKSNLSLNTIDRLKYHIKKFYDWSYENSISNFSGKALIPKIVWHRNTKVKTYYSKEEIEKLMNVIDVSTFNGKEDYLIISLIVYYGLRISDVNNLKISNIDFQNNTIKLIQCKTKKKIELPLINNIKYSLLDYLKNVRTNNFNSEYIFTNKFGKVKNLENKRYIVKKYLIKAEININGRKCGFHSLRHSFSTMLLNENVSLYTISKILGHSHIDVTMNYLDIDVKKLKFLSLEVPYVK